jgi:steroid delta-isomerase-like uncharacterized protein
VRVNESASEALVRRFYDELWNAWRLDLADEIVARDLEFRGSLGATAAGREEFLRYVEAVRSAFPDWHNRVEELIVAGDRVVARLTWTGTHRGEFAGIAPTGRVVEYVGAALFRTAGGRIAEAWVVGDTHEFWRSLS